MPHTISYIEREVFKHTARCRCGWVPPKESYPTKQMVEDEVEKHQRSIERVQLHMRHGSGTMKGDRDHAMRMAADPNVSEQDRRLWQQLATELDNRLGGRAPRHDNAELPLFEI